MPIHHSPLVHSGATEGDGKLSITPQANQLQGDDGSKGGGDDLIGYEKIRTFLAEQYGGAAVL